MQPLLERFVTGCLQQTLWELIDIQFIQARINLQGANQRNFSICWNTYSYI
jgi:hypothetical protein